MEETGGEGEREEENNQVSVVVIIQVLFVRKNLPIFYQSNCMCFQLSQMKKVSTIQTYKQQKHHTAKINSSNGFLDNHIKLEFCKAS